jgi:hypothetical protein
MCGRLKWVAVALVLSASPAHAAPPSTAQLEGQWEDLNEECRGGDYVPHGRACRMRENVYRQLERRGICYVYSDWRVYPQDYRWHSCHQARPPGWRP